MLKLPEPDSMSKRRGKWCALTVTRGIFWKIRFFINFGPKMAEIWPKNVIFKKNFPKFSPNHNFLKKNQLKLLSQGQ